MAVYGTVNGAEAYWLAAGYTVPVGDKASALQRGTNYVDAVYGPRFTGTPTGGIDQELAWPRTGAIAYGSVAVDSALIPQKVINAAYEAAIIELGAPGSLGSVTKTDKMVKRQKVEGIEREFFAPGDVKPVDGVVNANFSPTIHGFLQPFLLPDPAKPSSLLLSIGR